MTAQISNKRLALGSIAAIGGRISNAASQLLITGILSRTLNANAFGLWTLLYTIYFSMPNLDFGLGQALRLKLADLNARGGNANLEERLFWNVSWMLLILGVTLGIIAGILIFSLQNIETRLVNSIFFFSIACSLAITFNLGTQVFYAYEEGFQRGILDVCQAISLIFSVWIISRLKQFNSVIFGFYSVSILFNIIALLWFIQKRQWKVQIPQFKDLQNTFQEISHSSFWFWVFAVFNGSIFGTLPLFVASIANLEQVGHFVILHRLFGFLITLHYAWISMLQSAYTRSIAQHNWNWVKRTWQYSMLITVVFMISMSIFIIFLHQSIIHLWTGKNIFDPIMVITLAFLAILLTWINTQSVVLSGIGIIKPQAYWFFCSFAFYIILNSILILKFKTLSAPIAVTLAIMPIAVLSFTRVKSNILKLKSIDSSQQ